MIDIILGGIVPIVLMGIVYMTKLSRFYSPSNPLSNFRFWINPLSFIILFSLIILLMHIGNDIKPYGFILTLVSFFSLFIVFIGLLKHPFPFYIGVESGQYFFNSNPPPNFFNSNPPPIRTKEDEIQDKFILFVKNCVIRGEYESYLCFVNRIPLGDKPKLTFSYEGTERRGVKKTAFYAFHDFHFETLKKYGSSVKPHKFKVVVDMYQDLSDYFEFVSGFPCTAEKQAFGEKNVKFMKKYKQDFEHFLSQSNNN